VNLTYLGNKGTHLFRSINLNQTEIDPDPAAFSIPPAVDPVTGLPRFGDAGRNTIVGPGLNNIDGSLRKMFLVKSERDQLVVRMDVFNVMNDPNGANPDTNISDVNIVGSINAVNKNMRQAQFAAEFRF
jgi:hypothetical protein